MPAYPAFQAVDIAAFFGQTEVIPPAVQISAPLVSKLITAQTLAALPQLPYSVLESLQAARGHFDLPGRVDPKSQELALPGPPYSALGRVDFQPQLLANPLRDTGQHPLGGRLTAYLDVAVVGIPHKGQPPLLQLPVQCVQVDVGQQGRERPALWRAGLGHLDHSFQHDATAQVLPD